MEMALPKAIAAIVPAMKCRSRKGQHLSGQRRSRAEIRNLSGRIPAAWP